MGIIPSSSTLVPSAKTRWAVSRRVWAASGESGPARVSQSTTAANREAYFLQNAMATYPPIDSPANVTGRSTASASSKPARSSAICSMVSVPLTGPLWPNPRRSTAITRQSWERPSIWAVHIE